MLAALLAVAGQSLTFERPNILLFLVDDLGWQDVSVPFGEERSAFNEVYRTPNLEAMVPESVKYTNAYAACPVCTPSRTAIMTGKSPVRTHITYWTLNGDMSAEDAVTKAPAWQWQGLEKKDAPFLPQVLADSGYRTIHVGKAHFGAVDTFAADPTEIGFQVNIAGHAAGGPGSFYGTQKFMASLRQGQEEKAQIWDVPGLEKYHGEDIYLTEALTLEAKEALREAKESGKPFFMNFAPYAVHAPIMANKRYLANYPESMDARERAYATMIETYDKALGDLVAELKELGEWENTVVIFTSDNGGLSAHARAGNDDRNAPLRAGKGSFYEGGVRVPLLVRRPYQESLTIDQPVVGTDLYALVLYEARLWEKATQDADLARLFGRFTGDKPIVWHMPHFWGVQGQGIQPFSAVRLGDIKLVYRHRDQGFELYDLKRDLGETRDLAAEMPERVESLAKVLGDELRRMGAQMPKMKSSGALVPWPDEVTQRAVAISSR